MPGRNLAVAKEGDDDTRVYLRPGFSVQADYGIELTAVEFGRDHCVLKAKPIRGVEPRKIAKRKDGRAFILTLT